MAEKVKLDLDLGYVRKAYFPTFVVAIMPFLHQFFDLLEVWLKRLKELGFIPVERAWIARPDQGEFVYTLIEYRLVDLPSVWIICWVLAPVLFLGCANYFLKLVRGEDVHFFIVFSRFHLFFKAIGLALCLFLLIGLAYGVNYLFVLSINRMFGLGHEFILPILLLSFILPLVVLGRCGMAFFVLADRPHLTLSQVLRESAAISSGVKNNESLASVLFFLGFTSNAVAKTLAILYYPYVFEILASFYVKVTSLGRIGEGSNQTANSVKQSSSQEH